MQITLDAASPIVIPSIAANPGMPVTNTNPSKEALRTALDAPAMEELELPVPATAMAVMTASNESQLGASYLHNHTHQATQDNMFPCAVQNLLHRKILNLFLLKG